MARAVKRIHIQQSVLTMCLAMYEWEFSRTVNPHTGQRQSI